MTNPRIRITGRQQALACPVFTVDRIALEITDSPDARASDAPRSPSLRTRDAFVLRTRDWCNVLAISPGDEIVFVRQFRFGTGTDTLELPGGVIDPGESPREAAVRELREESGYHAGEVEPLLEVFANPALQDTRVHTFLARHAVPSAGGPHLEEGEFCEVVLVPRREIIARLDAGDIAHSLCRLPLELFLRRELLAR